MRNVSDDRASLLMTMPRLRRRERNYNLRVWTVLFTKSATRLNFLFSIHNDLALRLRNFSFPA